MQRNFSYFLFFLVIFLVAFSLLFFACLSAPASFERFGNTTYYFIHQLLYGFLPAIVAGVIAYLIPLKFLKKYALWVVLLNIGALFLVFIPGIGTKIGGASRWINLGSFTVQPSEFLKLSAIIYLSAWIASKLSDAPTSDWKTRTQKGYHNFVYIFLPFIAFLGIIAAALYFQRDVSTLGIISLTLLALYFSARTPVWHTVLIVVVGLGILLFLIWFEPYRLDRFLTFLHPEADPLGKGFQLRQSLISLGSGGVFGLGFGMSVQKFDFLPQAMSDSIFAIFGEELGIIGAIALIVAFVLICWLGIKISRESKDRFSKMVAIGIVFWITLQAFINIASAAGAFPLAGIPLPFFSYGGSHLVAELIGIGLLLNISKNS